MLLPSGELIWADLECACVGPREWGLACLYEFDELFRDPGPSTEFLRACQHDFDADVFRACVEARKLRTAVWYHFMALTMPRYQVMADLCTQKLVAQINR